MLSVEDDSQEENVGYCELLKKGLLDFRLGLTRASSDSGGKNKWRQGDGETQIVKTKKWIKDKVL